MIEGFEEYTLDVTDSELEIIEVIAKALSKRVGKDNSITNDKMRGCIEAWNGQKISAAKIRRYVQYIRAHNMVTWLCASKKGYYVAQTLEEWTKYREAFRSRVDSMRFTLACMNLDTAVSRANN